VVDLPRSFGSINGPSRPNSTPHDPVASTFDFDISIWCWPDDESTGMFRVLPGASGTPANEILVEGPPTGAHGTDDRMTGITNGAEGNNPLNASNAAVGAGMFRVLPGASGTPANEILVEGGSARRLMSEWCGLPGYQTPRAGHETFLYFRRLASTRWISPLRPRARMAW
jgi:hypothetical protein